MHHSNPIAEYGEALARELSFDAALSRRVKSEVEDHLWEAATCAQGGLSLETQRRAVVNFGDPREFALQYAASSLHAQMRRIGIVLALAVSGIYVAMKGRVAWYGLVRWEASRDEQIAGAIGIPVDRFAFLLAIALALLGCAYIVTRRAPVRYHVAFGKQLKRCIALCSAATGALLLSVLTDAVLTGIRLSGTPWSPAAWVPALTQTAEIAGTAVLMLSIRNTIRRTAVASSLLLSETTLP
jgi:hypothetical protein